MPETWINRSTPASRARSAAALFLGQQLPSTVVSLRRNRGKALQCVLTPVKVTNRTAKGWIDQIRNEFGFDLVLMTREDFITSLMEPANAPICRTQLGLPVAIAASETQDLDSVRAANSEVIAAWLAHPRLSGKPMIALQAIRLDQAGKETGDALSLAEIQTSLREGRRLVLEGSAGRGKTTMLVHLAQQRANEGGLALLVDFPELVRSRQDILEFIAHMPQYRARGI